MTASLGGSARLFCKGRAKGRNVTDELTGKLEWGCQYLLDDFSKRCSAPAHSYQMPHLVPVWRVIHVLAMRGVIKMRAFWKDKNEPLPAYALLRLYVGAVNVLDYAVHDAAIKDADSKGRLTLRDTLTGAPLRAGSWIKPDFRSAIDWFDAIEKRDMALTYEILYEWRCEGIHFNEAVTVVPSEFIQWSEFEGICPLGELEPLLAHIAPPTAETQSSATVVDARNIQPALTDARKTDPVTIRAASDGALAGLSTPDIAAAFDGLGGWSEEQWNKNLGDGAQWLVPARRQQGRRGKGRPSVWDPVHLAKLLVDHRGGYLPAITTAFRKHPSLEPWRRQWGEYLIDINDWKQQRN